ncbi:MAG: hypothetical protein WB471_03915 [Nocardioides sp.]
MFTHSCSSCERRQLIFPSQISAVTPDARGIAYHFTCWCGESQTAVQRTVRSQATSRSQVVRAA